MRIRIALSLIALLPAVALAQHKPREGERVAGIAAPPQPTVTPVTVPPPGQFLYGSVPILVTPDGRVFADFGNGYEQLVRNCATPLSSFQGNYPNAQPAQQPVQPSVTQPAPNPQTASQQMLNLPRATMTNSQSCWSTDSRGKVLVGR